LINDVNVKFIEYTEDQGKGKSKMESIYLRAQEKLEDLDFKNIIKLHCLGIGEIFKLQLKGFFSKGPIIAPYEASLYKYFNSSSSNSRAPL
jgi:hypothetical protein